MSDRIQVHLRRTFNKLQEARDEYNASFDSYPLPWSAIQKVRFNTQLQLLKQSYESLHKYLNEWENIAKNIENADERKAEYDIFDAWMDNTSHRRTIKDVNNILLEGKEYLLLESPPSNASNISSPSSNQPSIKVQKDTHTSYTTSSSIHTTLSTMQSPPPGFEQQRQQCYLDAPPGFEFAVVSTSTTPTEILSDRPQKIFQARDQCSFCVQGDGMSLKIVGGEDLSEKASYSSMPVSRGSNVMEGRKKYGIFCRPTIRVTAIARSRPHGSNVRGASIVRSRSCAWDTVLYQIDRGSSTYIVFDAFIIMVFDGGGKFSSTVIVILDDVLKLQYADRDKAKRSNVLCCLRGWWQCRGDSAILFFSSLLLLWRYVN